ncbi:unnamed protein product, partial [Urochloa humidicola]
ADRTLAWEAPTKLGCWLLARSLSGGSWLACTPQMDDVSARLVSMGNTQAHGSAPAD